MKTVYHALAKLAHALRGHRIGHRYIY